MNSYRCVVHATCGTDYNTIHAPTGVIMLRVQTVEMDETIRLMLC